MTLIEIKVLNQLREVLIDHSKGEERVETEFVNVCKLNF